jgi:hypothetical protein
MMSMVGVSRGAKCWFANRERHGPGGRRKAVLLGLSYDCPPGSTFDHHPQHFPAVEFDVFGEDRERGDFEGASVLRGLSGVALTFLVRIERHS